MYNSIKTIKRENLDKKGEKWIYIYIYIYIHISSKEKEKETSPPFI